LLQVRFLRFVLAGSTAFLVDAGTLTVLVSIAGWPPTWSRGISFAIAVTVNWLIHRNHVFEATSAPRSEYVRFMTVQILGAAINLSIYFLLIAYSPQLGRWPVIPLAIGAAASMFVTYFSAARFVFVRKAADSRVTQERQMNANSRTIAVIAIAATSALIAVFLATVHFDSAFVDGEFIPRSNDSFYHARRILDAALGSGFYEFDPRLHVPDGTWVPWPWGYDFLSAQALRLVLWLHPEENPMAFLSYVPVVFAAINCMLFTAAAMQAGLRPSLALPAALALALLPISQLMHSVGMIDHHFLEFTFVLLANWLGLRWFADPGNSRRAIALGAAVGAAVAFHNGLFILQIPLLVCSFILWLRGNAPPAHATLRLGAALIVTTILVAIPASGFRSMMFEFALLSWFHVYIACCSAFVLLFMAYRASSLKNFAMLAGISTMLAVPILAQTLQGASFLSGGMSHLDGISEVHSPFRMFTETYGPRQTASFYSWLIVIAPCLLCLFVWRSFREKVPRTLYFMVWGAFGLGLLLLQYRLNYFGLLALFAGACLFLQKLAERFELKAGIAAVVALATMLVAFQPALRERLFIFYPPAADEAYADARVLFKELKPLCAADPGLVLASADDGNAILFHTECSVISNNFIMRPEDKVAMDRIFALMRSNPREILEHEPAIKYVLLRTLDFAQSGQGDGTITVDRRNPIAAALLREDALPRGFETVDSVYVSRKPDGPASLFARLIKVDKNASASLSHSR